MRTTITLDADVTELIKRSMRERGLTQKQAVNEAIRHGLGQSTHGGGSCQTFKMGSPSFPLDQALRLAGELED